jgi:hypothetical protein
MKRALGLLILGLAGCVPTQSQQPYQVDEVQLLFPDATERWSFFYGTPQSVKLGDRTLTLAQGPGEALTVDTQAWRREVSAPLPARVRTTKNAVGLQAQAGTPVKSAWLYDKGWSSLGGMNEQGGLQTLTATPGAPRFEGLSQGETDLVLREILSRAAGRPAVLYEVSAPLSPLALDPAPSRYTTTALAVQYGLGSEDNLNASVNARVLAQGSNAAYSNPNPAAFVAGDAASLAALWRSVGGNQLPAPAAPTVNFAQSRVVAFFWGQKTSGGYSVQYLSSRLSGNTLHVTLRLAMPAPGSMTTQVLTSPFVALEVTASFSRVEFVDEAGQLLASSGG